MHEGCKENMSSTEDGDEMMEDNLTFDVPLTKKSFSFYKRHEALNDGCA